MEQSVGTVELDIRDLFSQGFERRAMKTENIRSAMMPHGIRYSLPLVAHSAAHCSDKRLHDTK